MSFFDEADEPDEPRRPPRAAPRRPRQTGRGRPPTRPPGEQQQIQTRRIVAVVVIVIVIVILALLIHGCESSQSKSSLRDYSASVYRLINQSDNTGKTMFKDLHQAASSGASKLQEQLAVLLQRSEHQLSETDGLSVPGAMARAQQHLSMAMQMRRDGISLIASNIQKAMSTTTAKDGVAQITLASSHFFASDVIYKAYVGPEMARALHGSDIAVDSTAPGSVRINAGQFLPDLGWLDPTDVGVWIGAKLSTKEVNGTGGLRGHSLNGVTVDGTALTTTGTNDVAASPAPTFDLSITNGGDYAEYRVECEVKIAGLSDEGTTILPETKPKQTYPCDVPLPEAPTPGSYEVTAEVLPVPGEKTTSNNSLTFAVKFTR